MRIRRTSIITTWWVTAFMLFAGMAVDGAVLCVGDDGHVDLETATTACCLAADLSSGRTTVPSFEGAAGGCRDCVDLGIGVESLRAAKKSCSMASSIAFRHVDHDVIHVRYFALTCDATDKLDWLSDALSSTILLT